MTHEVNNDFLDICRNILKENKSEEQWAKIESDDMFQQGIYEGGFDATGMTFWFSIYENGQEYWFEFPLSDVTLFDQGLKLKVDLIKADY